MAIGRRLVDRVLTRRFKSWAMRGCFVSADGALIGDFPMIDLTRGVEIGSGETETASVLPAVSLRSADLCDAHISAVDLVGARLAVNGVEWKVARTAPKPGPFGPDAGEVYLLLVEPDD